MKCKTDKELLAIVFSIMGTIFYGVVIIAALILFFSCSTTQKNAESWKQNCTDESDFAYCVTVTGNKTPKTIVFFHGLLDGVQSPKRSTYKTSDIVQKINDADASHVVNISFGKSWMLSPVSKQTKKWKEVFDKLNLPKPYVGLSVSMGAHNLVTINYTYPNLFEKMVFIVPMILREKDYEKKFNILDPKNPGALVGGFFSRKDWAKYNPFALGIKGNYQAITCSRDEFSLAESAKEFFKDKTIEKNCNHLNPIIDEVIL